MFDDGPYPATAAADSTVLFVDKQDLRQFLPDHPRVAASALTQMEQLRSGELPWEYELRGPYEFRIKVSRMATSAVDTPETVIAVCNH